MTQRAGDWMQTVDGRAFWPLDPRPDEIHIEEIAAALSRQCRFAGHIRRGIEMYSVAEHCVHVAQFARSELKLAALLHDASEAYLQDIIRPVKPSLAGYGEIEDRLMKVIGAKFGFDWPPHPEIKRIDNAILADEQAQVMAPPPQDWRLSEPPLGATIYCWSPAVAEGRFLESYRAYSNNGKAA